MPPRTITAFFNADQPTIDPFVPRLLRYAEWALFAILEASILYQVSQAGFPELELSGKISILALICIAVLSCFFPIDRPLWQRRAYVFAEIACITLILMLSASEIGVFYLIFLVRSCFLLPRRDVVVTTIAIFTALIGLSIWSDLADRDTEVYLEYAQIMNQAIAENYSYVVIRGVINSLTNYIPFSAIVVLAGLTLVSERESRQQAAALTEKVSVLTSDLERTRIAREINSALGDTLTALNKQIALAQHLHEVSSEDTLQTITQAEKLSVQSLQEARATLSTLRQGKFDLGIALDALVEQANQSTRLTVYAKMNLPGLPLAVKHQLYFIFKETLDSLERLQRSLVVVLWVKANSESITVVIEEKEAVWLSSFDVRSHLQSIEKRIQFLQGQLYVHCAMDKGMSIQVSIPR